MALSIRKITIISLFLFALALIIIFLLLNPGLLFFLRLQALPASAPTTITKTLTWTPTAADIGTHDISIVVDDQEGGVVTKNITINVAAASVSGDVNSDGVVNVDDLQVVTSNFGTTPGAP